MELNYKKHGDGSRTLVILHGLMGSLDNWQSLARKWGESFSVYTLDSRNHGRSPHHPSMNYDDMVEDLYGFCLDHDLESIYLLGHSMGGKTAMLFSLKYPEIVKKLIVADIAPVPYKGGHEPIFDAMVALRIDELSSRVEAEALLKENIKSRSIRQFVLKNLRRLESGSGYKWKINLSEIRDNYPMILGFNSHGLQYKGPVLFLRGGSSDYVDEKDIGDYREIFPRSFVRTIDKAGHWLHAEQPDLFYKYVKTFVLLKEKERMGD